MTNDAFDRSARALRFRAEQRLIEQPQTSPVAEEDARRALHELQVYQVELQLQNEALQESEAAAREASRRLEELNHSMEERIVQRTAELTATTNALELEIRQRQAVEDELRVERSELEHRVQERTHDLEHATADARAARLVAEEASLQKNHFLAKVSHELRTPLQSMLGWSQVLQRNSADPELAARAADRIMHNVGLQARLIDDLLDISRIMSGKLQLSCHEVAALDIVERAAGVVRGAAQAKGVSIEIISHIEPATRFLTDATRLEQVVWNLLSNAVRASSEGGRVQLSVDIDDEALRLTVKDWGVGIGAAELAHIFEPFRQGESSGGNHGGLGLGLTIVRHIVTLLSGVVTAHSEGRGRGAEFVVHLPLQLGQGPSGTVEADALSAEQTSRLAGLKVVYVEDEPDIAESCGLMLRALGVKVETCVTFEQAQRRVLGGGFDILLTDLRLDGGHSGVELLQLLRQTPNGRSMPALVLSAHGSEADRRASLDAGFAQHLVKPSDANSISTALLAQMGGRLP